MENNTTNVTAPYMGRHPPLEMCIPVMTSCGIALVSNIFVCYLILAVPRLKTATNVFVFSICVCNMLFTIILLPVHCFLYNNTFEKYTTLITILLYISNLSAVSYDRLVSITKPMLYMILITKQKAIYIVVAMWVIPTIYGLLPLIWQSEEKSIQHKIYLVGTLIIFMLAPLFFIIFVYIKVCLEMKNMHKFKKKSLTPSGTFVYKGEMKRKSSSRFQELRKLPAFFLRSSQCNDTWNGDECFENVRKHSRRISRGNMKRSSTKLTMDNASFEDKHTPLTSKVTIPEESPMLNIEYAKPIDNNNIESDYRSVGFPTENSDSDADSDLYTTTTRETNGNIQNGKNIPHAKQHTSSVLSRSSSILNDHEVYYSPKRCSSLSKMKRKAYELKASLAFLIVALTYMFTWLPVIIMTFFEVLDKHQELPQSIAIFSIYAIALNALSDPFLYGLLLPNFRKTLKILLRRISLRLK